MKKECTPPSFYVSSTQWTSRKSHIPNLTVVWLPNLTVSNTNPMEGHHPLTNGSLVYGVSSRHAMVPADRKCMLHILLLFPNWLEDAGFSVWERYQWWLRLIMAEGLIAHVLIPCLPRERNDGRCHVALNKIVNGNKSYGCYLSRG